MTHRPPKKDPRAPEGRPVPAPKPADYSDEISNEQDAALRTYAPQDESKMGPLVHELAW